MSGKGGRLRMDQVWLGNPASPPGKGNMPTQTTIQTKRASLATTVTPENKTMNTTKPTTILAYSFAVLISAMTPSTLHAQGKGASSYSYIEEPKPEPPKSSAEKLQSLQKSHDEAFAKLTATLNRIPTEPDFLGAKELFEFIDQSDREMNKLRSACASLMSSLRSEAKIIKESSSFTDEQKTELLESADAIAKDCSELSAKLGHAIQRLASSYKIVPRWKTIYRSYRNLQGEAKATEQVKSQIEAYLKSFTEEPAAASDAAGQPETLSTTAPDKAPSAAAQ